MIKDLTRMSIKLSTKALLLCLIIVIALLANSLVANGKEVNKDSLAFISSQNINESDFIIDSPTKFYDDINKFEKVANMKFKVPDFLPDKDKANGFEIIKLSDKDNALAIFFGNSNGSNFSFLISGSDPIDVLNTIESSRTKAIENIKINSQKQPLKLGGISGLNVKLTTTLPARQIGNKYSKESQKISNYYAWKDEGLWYTLEYNSTSKSEENSNVSVDLSEDEVINIVKSLKYPEEVKNVDYSIKENASAGVSTLNIYNKEDLEKAKTILGFNPKFPLNIGDDIKITGAIVGIAGEENIKNNIIRYQLNNFYSSKNCSIIFNEQKDSKFYENISKNKFLTYENFKDNVSQQIKVEKLNINSNDVFKYYGKNFISQVDYVWKENDIYYSLSIFGDISNSDEIVKQFIESKPIE